MSFPPQEQPRFYSEEEILSAIDEKKAEVLRLRESAKKLHDRASEIFRKEQTSLYEEAFELRERADAKFDKATQIEKGYMTHLKNKLSEFRTLTLKGIDVPESVTK